MVKINLLRPKISEIELCLITESLPRRLRSARDIIRYFNTYWTPTCSKIAERRAYKMGWVRRKDDIPK